MSVELPWAGDDQLQYMTQADPLGRFLVRAWQATRKCWFYYEVPASVVVVLHSCYVEEKNDEVGHRTVRV